MSAGWIDRPHQFLSIGDLSLESGETLRECSLVRVEHGRPNAARDNTVLVCCAIGSTHHRLDFLIGEGRALDPSRHHILVIDALGNGLSSSPSNSARQPGSMFPRISIRDMVESQRQVLDRMGIDRLHAVVGASMGGMQALQWAVSQPDRVHRVVAMTPMARSTPWSQLMNELSRRALFEDSACTRPRRRSEAMRLWAPLTQLVVSASPRSVRDFGSEAALHEWMATRETWFEQHGPDPFDWLGQTLAYDAHDVGHTPGFAGDTDAALRSIRARTLVLAPALDLYNPSEAAREAALSIPGACFDEIPSIRGHQAASGIDAADSAWLNERIRTFLFS
jgi:homoserine O-acetyltransferase